MTTPLAYVASSGKSIGIRCLDSSNNPVNIAAVASLNDIQTLTLSGTPSGGNFTLGFGGQTTGSIATASSLPTHYLMFQFAVTAAHAQTIAVDVGNRFGGNYSRVRVDVFDGISGTTPGPLLVGNVVVDENTPTYDTAVSLDGTSTSYMKTIGTVTPAGSLIVVLITCDSGGTGNQTQFSVATCRDNVTTTVQKCGVKDSGFSYGAANYQVFGTNSAFYNGNVLTTLTGFGQTLPLSIGGAAVTLAASTIQSALTALSNIGSGNLAVSDTSGVSIGPYVITFQGALGNAAQSLITSSSSAVTIAHTVVGGNAPTYSKNGGAAIKLFDLLWGDGYFYANQTSSDGPNRPSALFPLPQQTQTKYYPYNAKVVAQSGYGWTQTSGAGISKQAVTTVNAGDSILTYCEQFQNANGTGPITVAIYLTWVPDATLSTSVPILIQSSSVASSEVFMTQATLYSGTINQSITPSDLHDQGVWWKLLGTFTIEYPVIDLLVTITNASGKIAFDALQVRPTSTDISQIIAPGDTIVLNIPDGYLTTTSGPLTGLSNLAVTNSVGRSHFALPTTPQTLGVGYNVPGDFITFGAVALYSSLHRRVDFSQTSGVTLGTLNYPVSGPSSYIDQIPVCGPGSALYPRVSNIPFQVLRPGMYVVEWTGVGDCQMIQLGIGYTITEQTGQRIVNPAGNRRVYLLGVDTNLTYGPSIFLRVYASGSATAGVYPFDFGNLRIWQPDPLDPTGMTPWLTNRTTFYAPNLTCLQGATTLRFLDWNGANANNVLEYTDYRKQDELMGPSRKLSVGIASIAPVSSGGLFYPTLYVSVLVTTTTAHPFNDFSQPTLNTTGTLTFSTGQTLAAGSYLAEQIRVVDSTHFQAWLPAVTAPATLSATVTGGTATLATGNNQSPWIDQFLLCNTLNAGCHLNLSLAGSANCHYQEGVSAGQNLNANLTIYLENGNEPWNTQFGGTHGLLNLTWVETGTFDYANMRGMVVTAAAAYAQFMAGLASTGWSGTVVWGYGSGYGGVGYTTSICSAATSLAVRLDGIYIAPYVGNYNSAGPEINFNRLYDTMDSDQGRDAFCQYLQDGGWDRLVGAHRTAMNTAGYTAAKLLGYEGMIDTIVPGQSRIGAFERTAAMIVHPEMFANMAGCYLPFLQTQWLTNINLYTGYGIGFYSLGPEETSLPNTWPVWLHGGQAAGTGNWTTDAINITNPAAYNQITSEFGGGVKYWQALLPSHAAAARQHHQMRTTGASKRLSRWG